MSTGVITINRNFLIDIAIGYNVATITLTICHQVAYAVRARTGRSVLQAGFANLSAKTLSSLGHILR